MSKSAVRWLYDELPGLVAKGVVSQDAADRLHEHYGPAEPAPSRVGLAMVILSALCALLIGLGLILILAHNWDAYPRYVKTVLSIVPMLTGQALCAFALFKYPQSRAFAEGAGTWLGLTIGSSIALISQTYHIQGSPESFLLTWVLLGLPVVYAMNAFLPAILYLAGISGWCVATLDGDMPAIWYFALLAALIPFVYLQIRRTDVRGGFALLVWGMCASVTACLGPSLEKTLPGLWIVAYASLFAGMYLFGLRYMIDGERRAWHRGPLYIGGAGISILTAVFSFEWPWEQVGWHFYRYELDATLTSGILDASITGILLAAAVTLFLIRLPLRRLDAIFIGLAPIIALLCFGVVSLSEHMELIPMLVFNVYMIVLGGGMLTTGIRLLRFSLVNTGVAILATWIIARFFDIDMGYLARGLVFILVGAGLMAVNLYMLRLKRRSEHA